MDTRQPEKTKVPEYSKEVITMIIANYDLDIK